MPGVDSSSITNNFVGREREVAELVSACDSGANSDAHLFLIYGEPGIGKTRLADELASRAKARGLQVLWGRCWEGDGAPSYWPWIQAIRTLLGALEPERRRNLAQESEISSDIIQQVAQIIPDLRPVQSEQRRSVAEKLDSNEARFRLFDAVTNFLKLGARARPMLIVLDDLHDADEASLALLRFMARELKGAPILLVATYRDLELRGSPTLRKMIAGLAREAREIPLGGLSQSDVTKLVELRTGQTPDSELVAKLCAATNGNPLFVDGIVRMLLAAGAIGSAGALERPFKIPSGVREAIRDRLNRLSAAANSLLAVAAAIGNEFEFNLCRNVAGVSAGEAHYLLDEASTAGIATAVTQGQYRFSHALIREAVYDELDTNGRIQIHGKIANQMEDIYREDIDPHLAELAHHFRAAEAPEKAIEYLDRAANAASAVFAYAVAATHWREALALSKGQNDARRADILVRLGRVETSHLDPVQGVAHLEAALSLYQELKNEQKIAATNAFLGLALSAQGDFAPGTNIARAVEYFRQAQRWKGEWSDLGVSGWLHFGMEVSFFQALRIDEAIATSKHARQIFEADSNPAWALPASDQTRFLLIKGRHKEAAALFDEVRSAIQETPHPDIFRSIMWDAGWCRGMMRDPIEAERFLTIGMERKGLSPHSRAKHFEFIVGCKLVTGDLSQARQLAAEHKVQPNFLSQLAFREGDWEAALEMSLTMLQWARRTGHRWNEANSLSVLVQILRVTGDLRRAAEFLRQVLRAYEPSDFCLEMRNRPEAALLAIEMGRPDEATQHLEVCRAIIGHGEGWFGTVASVARAEGMLAATEGRSFMMHFEQAIAVCQRYSLPWDEAEAQFDWGKALNTAGEYSDANEKFDAAIEIYCSHGAGQRWIGRVDAARHSLSRDLKARERTATSRDPAIFSKEGEFWTISYRDSTFRLKDAKGLRYIAYLLARPGQRIHVLDLIEALEGSAANGKTMIHAESEDLKIVREIGGPGPTIDARARSEYRTRLGDLQADLEEAERSNDLGRCERLRTEIEMIGQELIESSGFGGRAHKASSSAERARVLVGRHIRSMVEKIRREHPALGRHLANTIRTGYFCAYQADPAQLSWQL